MNHSFHACKNIFNVGETRGNPAAGDKMERRKKSSGRSRGQVNCASATTILRKIHSNAATHLYLSLTFSLRFEQEAEAVNADLKVKSLQSALDESTLKFRMFKKVCGNLQYWKVKLTMACRWLRTCSTYLLLSLFLQDFEAFKEHSTKLLTQERELNKTLFHMTG